MLQLYTYSFADINDHSAVTGYLNDAVGQWQAICHNLNLSSKIGGLQIGIGGAVNHLADGITEWLKQNYNTTNFGKPTWKEVAKSVNKIDKTLFLRIAKDHPKAGEIHILLYYSVMFYHITLNRM